MFDLDDCMAFVTSQSSKIFSEELERRLRPYNVTRTQWIAMHYIYTNKALNQNELAKKLSFKEPTVVRLLQKLEYDGYLLRTVHGEDKRKKKLELSDKGTDTYLNLLPIVKKFKADTTNSIPETDLQLMKEVLAKMVENAKRH